MADKVYEVTAVKCTRPSSSHDLMKSSIKHKAIKDDNKVRYLEEDPNQLQVAKARRPRRHTTGGSQQKDAIEKARQMIANDQELDPRVHEQNLGTLNRKELVSLLKTRYGDDIEKYRSLKKAEDVEVEHRNLIENGIIKPKKSSTILTYKTSGSRKGSTSSQDSSQTSQESLQYADMPAKFDSLLRQNNNFESKQVFLQNRKVSNGSSALSGYSSRCNDSINEQNKTIVTRETKTVVKEQNIEGKEPQPQFQKYHVNKVVVKQHRKDEDHSVDLNGNQPKENVLLTERQNAVKSNQQREQQKSIQDRKSERVLFLQYKDEIKRVNMPNSISSIDTLKALFVTSFPGKLSMVRIDERGLIYIKDKEADIFYELEDLGDIKPRALVQLREKTTSYDSLSSSQNEMESYDNRYTSAYNYNTMPVRGRRGNEQHFYAESLQDFPTRPRSGSGDSLRSDSFLSRPQRTYNPSKEQISYTDSGLLSPGTAKKHFNIGDSRITERPRVEVKSTGNNTSKTFNALSEPPKLKQRRQSEKEKKGGPTVEEQLADLTRLLHTAMHSDEEDSGFSERDRAPGKLDQNVIDKIVQLSEENYSKSPTKSSCYAPTALLEAKKREVENPNEDQHLTYHFDFGHSQRQGSTDDPNKGYMHESPDVYMKDAKKKSEYDSDLADSLLKSLQSPTAAPNYYERSTSSYVRSGGSQSTSLPPSPSKGTSSRMAVQTLTPTSPTKPLLTSMTTTATMTTTSSKQQLEPIQMDKMIGIASSAASLRNSILTLRSQLDELRLLQTNQSRNFKTFLNQSMQDFNALAANVAQNVRFGKGGHAIRDRRFRVQEDYDGYIKRQNNTSLQLSRLEEETEHLRREVVQRKRVLEPNHVIRLNSELESLGKGLAELKSRFSGLHDMLKIVMAGELEIIVNEERFLKDEPGNLDNLYARCKHLSGTLLTLQRLASVQQMARSNEQQHQQQFQHDINDNRVRITVNQSRPTNEQVSQQRATASRTVRFTSEGKGNYR